MDTQHSGTAPRHDTRNLILETLKRGIDDLQQDIKIAEPEMPEEHRLQLRRYRELGYLANQYRKLQHDTDLDEMDQRMQLLEDGLKDEEAGY